MSKIAFGIANFYNANAKSTFYDIITVWILDLYLST